MLPILLSVLDEATSQVGLDMERKMYTLCSDLGITLLSVGHRDSLRQYHHIELNFDGKCGWSVRPIVGSGTPPINNTQGTDSPRGPEVVSPSVQTSENSVC